MRFVAYFRVSTEKQGRSGLGLEAQRATVHSYLATSGGRLVAEFTEIESASGKRHRPALEDALARVRSDAAVLLVAKLDRLTREQWLLHTLKRAGVRFVCADMPDANELTVDILGAMAEHERRAISERTRLALAAAKARGVRLGTPGNLTDHARRRSVEVRRAAMHARWKLVAPLVVAWRGQGWTFRRIADELTALSVPLARGGRSWRAGDVRRVYLASRDVSGY